MASLRMHVDQENRVPPKQKPAAAMAAQPKRAALGAIDKKQAKAVGKQPLKDLNQREAHRAPKSVVVPVAQFQAFSVYEEDEGAADRKLRQPAKSSEGDEAETGRSKQAESVGLAQAVETGPSTPIGGVRTQDLSFDVSNCTDFRREALFEVAEYQSDIFAYLKEHELKHRPKQGYIVKQPDVTESMRAILVDWLVEVVEEYKMHTETLYLAVNYIDRFLSYMSVVRGKLQLVGTAAMYIAAKYEEIMPPEVSEFVYITDDTYGKHQVIRMEHLILRVLGFDVSIPTPLVFINAICLIGKIPDKTMNLAMYFSELALLDVEPYLQYLPSMIASSAIALAKHTLYETAWDESLTELVGYELKELEGCVMFLYEMYVKAPNSAQHAIPDKYKLGKYMKVSKIPPRNNLIQFD